LEKKNSGCPVAQAGQWLGIDSQQTAGLACDLQQVWLTRAAMHPHVSQELLWQCRGLAGCIELLCKPPGRQAGQTSAAVGLSCCWVGAEQKGNRFHAKAPG